MIIIVTQGAGNLLNLKSLLKKIKYQDLDQEVSHWKVVIIIKIVNMIK